MKLTQEQLKRMIKEEMRQMDTKIGANPELQAAIAKLYDALPDEAKKQLDGPMAEGAIHDTITDPGAFFIAMMSSPMAGGIMAQLSGNSGIATAAATMGAPIAVYILYLLKKFHDSGALYGLGPE